MKKRTILIVTGIVGLVALACVALFAAAALYAVPAITARINDAPPIVAARQAPQPQAAATLPPSAPSQGAGDPSLLAAYQGTLEQIYTDVSPSVVNISVVSRVSVSDSEIPQMPGFPFFNNPGEGAPQERFAGGLGSGFVWDTEGRIVTNNHVVEGADSIEVVFSDGTSLPAEVIGTDPDSDLAVIKVEAPAGLLRPVQLADSATVRVGQLAVAIGNPYGLEGTMTIGIVSAVGRSMPIDQTAASSYSIPDVIQTDASINPGNSGGVLVDANGMVIGVTYAIESSSGSNAGIGFAIPSAIVNNVVPALIENGEYQHSWLGISGATLSAELAGAMDLDGSQRGVMVAEVMPDSPAEAAGLRGSEDEVTIQGFPTTVGGDIITAIDDQEVVKMEDLIGYLARTTPGQQVTLSILRDGQPQTLEVTLAPRPSGE